MMGRIALRVAVRALCLLAIAAAAALAFGAMFLIRNSTG